MDHLMLFFTAGGCLFSHREHIWTFSGLETVLLLCIGLVSCLSLETSDQFGVSHWEASATYLRSHMHICTPTNRCANTNTDLTYGFSSTNTWTLPRTKTSVTPVSIQGALWTWHGPRSDPFEGHPAPSSSSVYKSASVCQRRRHVWLFPVTVIFLCLLTTDKRVDLVT